MTFKEKNMTDLSSHLFLKKHNYSPRFQSKFIKINRQQRNKPVKRNWNLCLQAILLFLFFSKTMFEK